MYIHTRKIQNTKWLNTAKKKKFKIYYWYVHICIKKNSWINKVELIVWINVDKVILLVLVYCLLSLENVVLFFVRDMTIPSLNKLFLSIWSILLSYIDLSITINSLRIWIIFNQQLCNTIFTRVPYLLIPTWLQSPGIVFLEQQCPLVEKGQQTEEKK